MLDKEIIECCRKLRLSRNLAEFWRKRPKAAVTRNICISYSVTNSVTGSSPAPKSWLPAPVSMRFIHLKDIALMKSPCLRI